MDIKSNNNFKALISTKHSFTGIPWWTPLITGVKMLQDHESKPDYLLPTPTRDNTGLIARPCSYQTALTWLRHILAVQNVTKQTQSDMTLHSLRLWAAEMAWQANIDRDKRKYIGQWAQEATADTYTRDHRSVIVSIWKSITDNITTLHPRHEAPKDPLDEDY